MDKLTKSDIVGVFQKPFTQEGFEGKAELVEFIGLVASRKRTEDWMVRFEGDEPDEMYRRMITY